jgi:iron complex outermembrane recepter protein
MFRTGHLRKLCVRAAVAVALGGLSLTLPSIALADAGTYQFDLPSQPLSDALRAVGRRASKNMLFDPALVEGAVAPALKMEASLDEVLRQLLAGKGLAFENVGPDTILLKRAETATGGDSRTTAPELNALDEVVVTAQKRMERLQSVPVPVTALRAETLASSNQLRVQDYYTKVPGLGLVLLGDGNSPTITIRGVTTGGNTNPTVGITIDDIPYGSSTAQGLGALVPDIDPSELARVEVLRGPQGTLYGASSIGGLLKFVTIDPSTDGISGHLQGGVSSVSKGDDLGYSARGAINLPLGETFAIRASGFTRRDPGYIDNVQSGTDDVNERESDGGRLSAVWRPSERFSLKLSALLQETRRLGPDSARVQAGFGELEESALRGTDWYGRDTEAYSATLAFRFGDAELISATGYSIDRFDSNLDRSSVFGTQANDNFQVTGASARAHGETEKLTQELRLSVPLTDRLEWLLGAFYTQEDVSRPTSYYAVDAATGSPRGTLLTLSTPSDFEEYAGFTHLTIDLTERVDVQFGGRISRNEQSFTTIRSGILAPIFFGTALIVPAVNGKDTAFTYLVTPRFRVSEDLMMYARLASGYRPGGPNTTCTANIACEYSADRSQNYELGVKGNLLEGALSFDASLYYIDWDDIQIFVVNQLGYIANAARAQSQGAELSVEWRPLTGLTVSGWAAYSDARLAEDFPSTATVVGRRGDRMPYSSKISGNLSVDHDFPLGSSVQGFVGGSVSYVDDRRGVFQSAAVMRQTFDSYTQADLRAGFRYDAWTVSLFVNNVGDERGELNGGTDSQALFPNSFTYIQPRTAGLSIGRTF